MRVRLLLAEAAPPGLVAAQLARLPPPFAADRTSSAGETPVDPALGNALAEAENSSRGQVDAARLLESVPEPGAGRVHLLLTGRDLFVPALTYVFGLSRLGGGRGVLSWARLRPDALFAPRGDGPGTLRYRLAVEIAHELGHAVGLVHCDTHDCAMRRSAWPEAVDLKRPAYCAACAAELRRRS